MILFTHIVHSHCSLTPSPSHVPPPLTSLPLSRPSPSHVPPPLTPSPSHVPPPLTSLPLSRPSPSHAPSPLTSLPLSRPSPSHAPPPLTPLPLSRPSSPQQVQHAEPIFNKYRRQGHQFSNNVCNKMLMGWSDKVGPLGADGVWQLVWVWFVSSPAPLLPCPSHYPILSALLHHLPSGKPCQDNVSLQHS